jgi:hypothetical protein
MPVSLSRHGTKQKNLMRQRKRFKRQSLKIEKTGCMSDPLPSKTMTTLTSNRRLLQVSLKADLYERLRQHCAQIDIPMAIWAREVIKRELEREL